MTRTVLITANSAWNLVNFRSGLIVALKNAGYRVISAAPRDAYVDRLTALVDAHYDINMQSDGTSPIRDCALITDYMKLLRATNPDVMLSYTIKPNIYGAIAARMCTVPVIANVSGLGTAFIRDSWLTGMVKFLYRIAFVKAYVFFQNPEDRDLFHTLKLITPEKLGLVPGSGIDLAYFHPSHNVPYSGTVRFVLIARMLWDKGIAEYVEAARIIKAQYPQVQFHLVGARGVRNKTAIPDATLDAWNAEGIVQYLGESDTIRDVIAQYDCVVLPSYREGMSRVLLEAAAAGKPLIATDVPGCKQAIQVNVNGFLCTVRDGQSLAGVMLRFIMLTPAERIAMGAASRAKAEAEFDEKKVFDAYVSKIAEITR